ncbi:MAG: hypothetical protein AAFY82_07665 [Pseudomonadota bacterium]
MSMMESIDLSDRRAAYTVAQETHDMGLDEYMALTAQAWDATPLNVLPDRSSLLAESWQIGPCMLSIIDVAPFIFETKRVHLENRGALIGFKKVVEGFESGDYASGEYLSAPGPIELSDPVEIGKSISTALKIQEIYVPRAFIGLSFGKDRLNKIYPYSAIGKIVHAEWDSLFLAAQSGVTHIPERTVERFLSSFKIALGVHPQREDVRTHARELLFRQIQRFIHANLSSPKLGSATILSKFGVSRASLYRMFEPLGGIRTYTTYLRASKALIEIWENRLVRGSVSAARDRWHFRTGNDFNRTVTRLFGNSPKRLLAAAHPLHPKLNAPSNFAFEFLDSRYNGTLTQMAA